MKENKVSDIRKELLARYNNQLLNEEGMVEMIGVSFIADEPSIFGTVDDNYIEKELGWYYSKSLNVYDMFNPPVIWKTIASNQGLINSNYGWCMFHKDNHYQYENVKRHLIANPNSRQAVAIYNRPSMHTDSTKDGMSDFMCTNAVNYRQLGDSLHATVQMRSNDVVYGYKNDYAWQLHILKRLCNHLNLELGTITWQVASLHVYPRHFGLLEDYNAKDNNGVH